MMRKKCLAFSFIALLCLFLPACDEGGGGGSDFPNQEFTEWYYLCSQENESFSHTVQNSGYYRVSATTADDYQATLSLAGGGTYEYIEGTGFLYLTTANSITPGDPLTIAIENNSPECQDIFMVISWQTEAP